MNVYDILKSIKSKAILWIMESKPYIWMASKVIPYIRFNFYYTKIRGSQYKQGYKILKAGHIIVSRDHNKLTSILVGGTWCHASLCVGKGEPSDFEVAEMTHENYGRSEFFDICKTADRVGILECEDWDYLYIRDKVIPTCLSLENANYDYKFQLGIKSLYCSELVYESDPERKLDVSLEDHAFLGRQYISPTGLANGKNVKMIWDSDETT